jgi:hypothetical protein
MSSDPRTALDAALATTTGAPTVLSSVGRRTVGTPVSEDTRLAIEVRQLVDSGHLEEARDLFSGLVDAHQRRASRIAYQYLRDPSEADEAVQDAFVKVFGHISSYREAWPFEVWFTRILINGCGLAANAGWCRPEKTAGLTTGGWRWQLRRRRVRKRGCSLASGERVWHRRSIGWTGASEPCSCCATTVTIRRARSAP